MTYKQWKQAYDRWRPDNPLRGSCPKCSYCDVYDCHECPMEKRGACGFEAEGGGLYWRWETENQRKCVATRYANQIFAHVVAHGKELGYEVNNENSIS